MKVLIAAGGTGGHIYPGISLAKEIIRRNPDSEVLFVGTSRGLENRIIPENGFQLSLINSAGLKKVGFVGKLKGLSILPRSLYEAWRLLRDFKPEVVVGAGGYVSGPVVLTAHFMGYPTMIMDSNAIPGFTNRRLARFIDRAALTFEEALPFFGTKGKVTGNPVRTEFFKIPTREPKVPVHLLITGGSQGSHAINMAAVAALPLVKASGLDFTVTHQTGDADLEQVRSSYLQARVDADIKPFISNIVEEFEKADLIICRAGATTCAEIEAAGKPAIMIPLPGAADDHQRKNAEALEKHGAVKTIIQSDLNPGLLAGVLQELLASPQLISQMGVSARKLARKDAAESAVDMIEELRGIRK